MMLESGDLLAPDCVFEIVQVVEPRSAASTSCTGTTTSSTDEGRRVRSAVPARRGRRSTLLGANYLGTVVRHPRPPRLALVGGHPRRPR